MFEENNDCNCLNCLKKADVFSNLTDSDLELINEHKYNVRYKPGEIIFKQGTEITHVMSFTSGLAKIYIEGLNDKNLILKIIKSGEFVGGPGIHVDKKHHYSVSTLTPVTACFIELSTFDDVFLRNKDFAIDMLVNINKKDISRFKKYISLTQKQMHGRVADAIFYLADEIFMTDSFEMFISRQDLADLTAMSKESVIRILKDLKDDKIIEVDKNHMTILDRNRLLALSQKG